MPVVPDSQALAAAVRDYRVDGLELVTQADADEAVQASLATGLLLLGEVHGVLENPRIVIALLRRFRIGGLALEWPASVCDSVRAWRAGGPLPEEDQLWWGDGRVTAGHYALLRSLPNLPVRMFDVDFLPSGATWSDRDAAMADTISRLPALANGWLVVAGNAHTATEPSGLGTPMGLVLRRGRPQLTSIEIRYRSGSFYNCGPRRFSDQDIPHEQPPGPEPAVLHLTDGNLRLTVPHAHEADVPHRRSPAAPVGP